MTKKLRLAGLTDSEPWRTPKDFSLLRSRRIGPCDVGRWVVPVFGTNHGAPLLRTGVVSWLRRSAGGEETEFDLIDGEGSTTHYDLATSGITSIRFRAGSADAPRSTSFDARK